MITPEIVSYIKAEKAKGTGDETIRANLLNNGWKQEDINEAMASLAGADGAPANHAEPITPEMIRALKQYRSKLRLVIFAALAIITIIFFIVNGYFSSGADNIGGAIFFIILMLLVSYGIASIAVLGTSPRHNLALEIVGIIAKIIGAVVLLIVLLYGLLFLFCLLILSSGGGRGF